MTIRARRRGFTLIELLVAMALTVFVMVILSEAFVTGLNTFSGLKAIGDMQENLRVATNNLREDLAQDHFEGKRRLSDSHLWTERPRNGFLAIYQGAPTTSEGTPDGIASVRATADMLHMTVKRKGNRLEDFFSASIPGSPLLGAKTDIFGSPSDATMRDSSTFKSQWAEVAYFLVRTGTTVDPTDVTTGAGAVPIFNLYRLELVVVPDSEAVNALSLANTGLERMSWYANGATVKFASPGELLDATKRGFVRTAAASYQSRASLVMADVVSFHVQALHYIPASGIEEWGDVQGGAFDSGSATAYGAQIKGISITIRGWDRGNLRARQVTLIQDL